ncbi:MAG: tRNA pseudouridine(13) synthase TruD [Candidatus Micrarchaeia archaeon]
MLTLTKSPKANGTIKSVPEDFVVEEITKQGFPIGIGKHYTGEELGFKESAEGAFSFFVLQKRNWNTIQALKQVARIFRKGIKSVNFAGTKDRIAVTAQLCSIHGVAPEQLLSLHIKDISINGAWRAASPIKLGDLAGNRFAIKVRDVSAADFENMKASRGELEVHGVFPNYFGEQRFGNRGNNIDIGISILKGDFERAAMLFLTDHSNEISIEAVEARERLEREHDFRKALEYFPKYLKYERTVIDYLARFPENYANAMRKLPRSLLLMFVHSVESEIFNMEVEERVKAGLVAPGEGDIVFDASELFFDQNAAHVYNGKFKSYPVGNLVGYNTTPNQFEKSILEKLGISTEDFKVKGMPELNCKGTTRVLFAPYAAFTMNYDEKSSTAEIRFSLPSGSYATVLLRELIDV